MAGGGGNSVCWISKRAASDSCALFWPMRELMGDPKSIIVKGKRNAGREEGGQSILIRYRKTGQKDSNSTL